MSKLCGNNLPKAYNVSGNTLKLSFKSGQQNLNKLGFIATYVSGKGTGNQYSSISSRLFFTDIL